MNSQYNISTKDIDQIIQFLTDNVRTKTIRIEDIEEAIGLTLENIAGAETLDESQLGKLIKTIAPQTRKRITTDE